MAEVLINLFGIFCSICSLQRELSGTVVATTNHRGTWNTKIPIYATSQWPFVQQYISPLLYISVYRYIGPGASDISRL